MILVDSIKKSFLCVIENPSITLFLVLFLIASNILAKYIFIAKTPILRLIFFICLIALFAVFMSGWFKVVKESTDRTKIKEKNYYSLFLEGIGEKIIPVSISLIIYSILFFIMLFLAQFIALKVFGDINFFFEEASKLPLEDNSFAQYFTSLNDSQKYTIYGWNLSIIACSLLFSFLTMFYFPAVLASNKNKFLNPIVSVWDNIKFIFKNFFSSLGMGIFIFILYMILAFVNALTAQNTILSIIFLLIYIYFISYTIMLIFNYYEEKNNSSDRHDSVGEDEAVDSVSEED